MSKRLTIGRISRPGINRLFVDFPQRRSHLASRFPPGTVDLIELEIRPARAPSLYLAYLVGLIRTFRAVSRRRLDVLIVEDMESALLGLVLRRVCRSKLAFDFIDDYAAITGYDGPALRHAAVRWLERIVPRAADLVIVTDPTKRAFCRALGVPPANIVMIPNGFDGDRFFPEPKDPVLVDRLDLKGRRVVVFVGKINAYYQIETILRALQRVVAEDPRVVFLCIGGGYDLDRLRAITSSLGLEAHVRFPGPVAYQEVPAWINLADVCLLSVPTESALILFEYLACGKAVVVPEGGTDKMSISEETFPKGVVLRVDPTLEGFASGICHLLENPSEAIEMGRKGRALVAESNTWNLLAPRYLEAIYGVVD